MSELTLERVKELLHYDQETGLFYWNAKRGRCAKLSVAGSWNSYGYRRIKVDGRGYPAHRLAWLHVHGRWPQGEIDHINGIKHDNRIANLCEATSSMHESGITAERARELFAYDAETGSLTWRKSGKGRRLDLRAGQIREDGYAKTKVDYQEVYNHRLIWLMVTGSWPQHHIDHINCDTSDNRWENLRDVPLPTNNENIRRPKSKNQSGYLGVDWRQDLRKFRSVITVKGRQINLGFFTDPADAHAAYVAAKRKLHTGCTI